MEGRQRVRAWIVGILGAALLAAPRVSAAAEPLKVGYLPVTGHAKFFVAKEQKFFEREGLSVELIEFVNSADGINALKAGKLDIGAFGTTAPLAHIAKGADLRIIGGIMGEDASIVTTAANAPKVKKVADLKGKKVATVRLATGDAVLRGALKDAGVNWKTDLQIFELKSPPAVIEAVKSGQVDAGVIWGPHDLRAEEQGLKVVIRSGELQHGHPCCRLTVNGADLPKAATWEKFLRAILRAERFAKENRKETVDAIVKYVKLDRALVEKAYYHGHLEQGSDPNLKGVRAFWATLQNSEFIDSKADIGSYVETKIYRNALDGLARENPKDPFWKKLQKEFPGRNG
ncbi:MAG: ABC transporter substrate-binding protein [Deltaproteobacteria bacterium]|nr:ABC transporter substrate-binding protein [Deltaproteobacteria bacterium]